MAETIVQQKTITKRPPTCEFFLVVMDPRRSADHGHAAEVSVAEAEGQ